MGMLDWLFGKRKAVRVESPPKNPGGRDSFEFEGGLLTVPARDYYGLYKYSPKKAWAISWKDSTPDGRRGGHREEGDGRYVLIDVANNAVLVDARMPRPNNGAVADNGSFCLEDWHFGSALSGTFHVFTSQGLPVITKVLSANILQSGISRNGLLAYCLTANSPTEDGRKLALYDLKEGVELFAVTPQRAGEHIGFDEKSRQLVVKVSGGGEYRYGADGALVDEDAADEAMLSSTNYTDVILTAEAMLKVGCSTSELERILAAVIGSRVLGADDNPAWKPTALKVQGLAHEALGQGREAIGCYEEALRLNPKIGVKRKLDSLLKRL
ncbi:tetratricopeptide repeat protein [Pseudomonas sp. RGM 3321]|uniref:tetratricopeptide repeat protein n=1 Tax=Pseudomonas sp. RGM 3321 TaxID=2930089 RepID=UPI001FCC4239|nr:tetratricopeptide repeat protein [Pseudomonas sp. RGM 3321]MCJ2370767.1 tetratricopeptide repeat protein [Pseudomonas sp. RGM 3321]